MSKKLNKAKRLERIDRKVRAMLTPFVDRIDAAMEEKGWTIDSVVKESGLLRSRIRLVLTANPLCYMTDLAVVLLVTTGEHLDFKLVPDLSTPKKAASHAEHQLKKGGKL